MNLANEIEEIVLSSDEEVAPAPKKPLIDGRTNKTQRQPLRNPARAGNKLTKENGIVLPVPVDVKPVEAALRAPSPIPLVDKSNQKLNSEITLSDHSPVAVLESHIDEEELIPSISTEDVAEKICEAEDVKDKNSGGTIITAEGDAKRKLRIKPIPVPVDNSKEAPDSKRSKTDRTSVPEAKASTSRSQESSNEGKNIGGEEVRGSESELKIFINTIGKRLKPDELKTTEKQLWRYYHNMKLPSNSAAFERKVTETIHRSALTVALRLDKTFVPILRLIKYFKEKKGGQDEVEMKLKKKKTKIVLIENKLKELHTEIEKIDLMDDNWYDEYNSPYLMKSRLETRTMKYFDMLCKITNCNNSTGRAIQKKIKLHDVIKYPEIAKAVESYLNSKTTLYSPDFPEVLKICQDAAKKELAHLDHDTVFGCATELFRYVVKVVKQRRRRDLVETLPALEESDDEAHPTNSDLELLETLKQNDLQRRTEDDILTEFTERQKQLKEEPMEVDDEHPDDSQEESDDDADDAAVVEAEKIDNIPDEIVLSSDTEDEPDNSAVERESIASSSSCSVGPSVGRKRSADADALIRPCIKKETASQP